MGMIKDIAILGGIGLGAYIIMKKFNIHLFPQYQGETLPKTEAQREWLMQKINVSYVPTQQEKQAEQTRQQDLSKTYGTGKEGILKYYEDKGKLKSSVKAPETQRATAYVKALGLPTATIIMKPTVKKQLVASSGGTALNKMIVGGFK